MHKDVLASVRNKKKSFAASTHRDGGGSSEKTEEHVSPG